MKTFLQAAAALAVVAIIAGGGFLFGRYAFPKCPTIEPGRSDTVTVYDTIRVKQPAPVSEEVVRSATVRVKQAVRKSEADDCAGIECTLEGVPPSVMPSEAHSQPQIGPGIEEVYTTAAPLVEPTPDSVDVEIPIERKVYETEDYRAVVEGFHASLTSLDIYRPTRIVTQTVPIKIPDTKRWSFGLHAGYGATVHGGRVIMVPTVGVGG